MLMGVAMQKLIQALENYINSERKLWYTLGLMKGPLAKVDTALDILKTIKQSDPAASSSFKYAIDLLYNENLFHHEEPRQALLSYINQYVPSDEYSKIEIAKYLDIYAPKKIRSWKTLWLFETRALSPDEEYIIQHFRKDDFPEELFMRSPKTDARILAIAEDLNNISSKVYTEIPRLNKKITAEILSISDDLNGLNKLNELVNSQVPLIKRQLNDEISTINTQLHHITDSSKLIGHGNRQESKPVQTQQQKPHVNIIKHSSSYTDDKPDDK